MWASVEIGWIFPLAVRGSAKTGLPGGQKDYF